LHQLTESAIRDVIGHSKLDAILTNGKQEITRQIKKVIEHSLVSYKLGIELLDVNLSSALPPTPVQQAFNDVIKAREDEQAYQNEAERYKESQLPIALGRAKRIYFEADAYKKEKILKAQAQAQRFTLLEQQYNQYPKLMKTRLYHETMDEILSNVSKIIVDPDLSHHMMYLNSLNENASVSLEKKATDTSSAQSINLTTPEKSPSKVSRQYFSGETPLNFNKD
jgi:membrane protease subunit HflK